MEQYSREIYLFSKVAAPLNDDSYLGMRQP